MSESLFLKITSSYTTTIQAFVVAFGLWLCGCSGPATGQRALSTPAVGGACLAGDSGWTAAAEASIATLLRRKDLGPRPLAVFDWDNTMIKNDVGAAVVHHVVQHGLAFRPRSWAVIPYLSEAAKARLASLCGGSGPRLPSAVERPACARELLSLYETRTLSDGSPGFSGYNHRTYKPSAAWQVQLLAGHTRDQVRRLARDVIRSQCAAPQGRRRTIAGLSVNGYLRLYRPMVELVSRLRRTGFDIWVVSASPQPVVEVFAQKVGIAADHVVGIRALTDDNGRLTRDFVGCGDVADSANTMITYIEGKRCWIQKVIGRKPLLSAGDSVTDVAFLRDAGGLRIVVDRGYPELMCRALFGRAQGQPWLITPMFIDPRTPGDAPYPCSSTACVDTQGKPKPCLDKNGKPLPDQPPRR